jgi:hypothetical protein
MSDYIPGPWYAKKSGHSATETGIVMFYKTRRIQVATARQPLFTAECQEANARLIAAAPELLEALEGLLKLPPEESLERVEAERNARAAIAKARGQ